MSLSPEHAHAQRVLTDQLLQSVQRSGYHAVDAPAFDDLELFERLYGREIRQRLLSFTTDREYALRPDLTASLCRALTQRLEAGPLTGPFRLAAAGPAWRHERVRPLRQRQFVQLGVERIGDAPEHTAEADMELLRLAVGILNVEGVAPAALRIGHAGVRARLLSGLVCSDATRRSLDALLDLTSRVRDRFDPPCGAGVLLDPADGQRRRIDPATHADADHIREVALRVANLHADSPLDDDTSLSALLPALEALLAETARAAELPGNLITGLLALTHSASTLDALVDAAAPLLADAGALLHGALGHTERVDLPAGLSRRYSLAFSRSIGYYTGFIYEIDAPVLGPDAGQLVGGGRYDDVMGQIGPTPYTAAGFAIGLERLLAALGMVHGASTLQGRFALPTTVWLFRTTEVSAADAEATAEQLRRRGLGVAVDPAPLAVPLEASAVPARPPSTWTADHVLVTTALGLCTLDRHHGLLRATNLATVAAMMGPHSDLLP